MYDWLQWSLNIPVLIMLKRKLYLNIWAKGSEKGPSDDFGRNFFFFIF